MMLLRALEPEDLDFLYELENDMDLWACGTSTTPISRYALKQYIASCKNDIFEDGQVRFGIQNGGNLVGLLDLTGFQPIHRRAEVGIVIHRDFQGMGLGVLALGLLKEYAQNRIGLHQLYAIVAENNDRARNLFLAAGYEQTHRLRDWLFSSLGEVQDAIVYQCFLGD